MNIEIDVEKVRTFYKSIETDANHRYKSWEHCFNYFLQPRKEIDSDKAALHLAFYLASWGMYRGSSFLLQKDYLIHKKLIEDVILNPKYKKLHVWDFIHNNTENIKNLFLLKDDIKDYYNRNIIKQNGKNADVSDVLSTKIILGTFGCVPAYDRYFIEGLRLTDKKFGFTFNEDSFNNLINVYKNNKPSIDELSRKQKNYKHNYPVMKIIDMHFWQIGSEKLVAEAEMKKQRKKKEKAKNE